MPQGDRIEYNYNHQAIAAGQSDVKLGAGKLSDILERIVVQVATPATSAVSAKDGAGGSSIPIVAANTPVGTYSFEIGAGAQGSTGAEGWHLTTGAGVTILAVGRF